MVLPGLTLTATYSPDHKLCRLDIASGVASKQQIDEVLDKAVPSSARGKKWNAFYEMDGFAGSETQYYEKLIIIEDRFSSAAINKNPGATVLFKEPACGWRPGRDVLDVPPSGRSDSGRQQ